MQIAEASKSTTADELSTTKPSRRRRGWLICAAWLALWSAGTLALDREQAYSLFKQQQAASFPRAEGQVLSSKLELDHVGGDSTYCANIRYRYVVAKQPFLADRLRYGYRGGEAHLQRTVAAHPVGSSVTVYYNPREPAEALLDPGLSSADFFFLLFVAPFNVVTLGSWAALAWTLLRGPGVTPASLRLFDSGTELRARLPRLAPVLIAAIAVFVVAGASFLIVGAAVGDPPPASVVAAAWATVLVAAAAAYFLAQSRMNDLVIDRVSGTLALPRGSRSRRSAPVPLADIIDVKLGQEADEGGSVLYFCLVQWTQADGQTCEAAWLNQPDRACAEKLVVWLREQCGLNEPAQ